MIHPPKDEIPEGGNKGIGFKEYFGMGIQNPSNYKYYSKDKKGSGEKKVYNKCNNPINNS